MYWFKWIMKLQNKFQTIVKKYHVFVDLYFDNESVMLSDIDKIQYYYL